MNHAADTIQTNIVNIQHEIASICQHIGRDPATVQIVAVSKRQPIEAIVAAYHAGLHHFGENRIEETNEKVSQLRQQFADLNPVWHMIGTIQSRKASDATPLFDIIHAVDRFKIADKLNQAAATHNKPLSVLLQVNISGEASKSGFDCQGWQENSEIRHRFWQHFHNLSELKYLKIIGLMTMAPYVLSEETRPIFASVAHLRDALQADFDVTLPELSMGMTNDYAVAIEEGATMVRIGRAIFGERS